MPYTYSQINNPSYVPVSLIITPWCLSIKYRHRSLHQKAAHKTFIMTNDVTRCAPPVIKLVI